MLVVIGGVNQAKGVPIFYDHAGFPLQWLDGIEEGVHPWTQVRWPWKRGNVSVKGYLRGPPVPKPGIFDPMLVTPFRTHLFQDRRSLHQFLSGCKPPALDSEQIQIVSLSLEIPGVDPLAALDRLQAPDQLHFYWEKRGQGAAIAATDPILQLQVNGSQRFQQAQRFISTALNEVMTAGALHLPFAGPHFFCSFTFFDQVRWEPRLFPAATVFLPRWQVACEQGHGVLVANVALESTTALEPLTEEIWQQWDVIRSLRSFSPRSLIRPPLQVSSPLHQQTKQFTRAVEATLAAISAGQLQKLVLAHTLEVQAAEPLDLCLGLDVLRDRYPDCSVFSVSNGRGQIFIGASPERLLRIQDHELMTDALAGSAPRGQTVVQDALLGQQLLSSQKDLYEQRVVLEFIQDCLRKLGIPPHMPPQPHLLQLPNIQHLRTLVTAQVPKHLHLLDILAALHPTPAVAGTPHNQAQEQIRRHETFERYLYAAPLGWVDHQGNGEFTVGIRSALLNGCQTRLYAGAGIVAGSDPQRELAEIQLKLHTLLDALV